MQYSKGFQRILVLKGRFSCKKVYYNAKKVFIRYRHKIYF